MKQEIHSFSGRLNQSVVKCRNRFLRRIFWRVIIIQQRYRLLRRVINSLKDSRRNYLRSFVMPKFTFRAPTINWDKNCFPFSFFKFTLLFLHNLRQLKIFLFWSRIDKIHVFPVTRGRYMRLDILQWTANTEITDKKSTFAKKFAFFDSFCNGEPSIVLLPFFCHTNYRWR